MSVEERPRMSALRRSVGSPAFNTSITYVMQLLLDTS
jgi:hypothetical protein